MKTTTANGASKYIAEPLRHLAVPIADLHIDPANARKHDDRNLGAIKASLARWGRASPSWSRSRGWWFGPATAG